MNPELIKRAAAALEYPRRMISDGFLPEECHSQEHFGSDRSECLACRDNALCAWLCVARENTDFRQIGGERMLQYLQFAVEYAVSMALAHEHDPGACLCSTCRWIRSADRLRAQMELDTSRADGAGRPARGHVI